MSEKNDCITITLTFENPECTFVLRTPQKSIIIDGFKALPDREALPYPAQMKVCNTSEEAYLLAAYTHTDYLNACDLSSEQMDRLSELKKRQEDRDMRMLNSRQVTLDFEKTISFLVKCTDPKTGEDYWQKAERSIWPGSVLDELYTLGQSLANHFYWDEAEAVWFVLTGRAPSFTPLRAKSTTVIGGMYNDAIVEFKILPWVSRKTLLELYERVQKRLLGCDNQPLRQRNLELFQFVERLRNTEGKLPSWRVIMSEWNNAHPSDWDERSPKQAWEYKNVRAIHRDYNRTRKTLLFFDEETRRLKLRSAEEARCAKLMKKVLNGKTTDEEATEL